MRGRQALFVLILCLLSVHCLAAGNDSSGLFDGMAVKKLLDVSGDRINILKTDLWRPWQRGFKREKRFVCM